MHMLFFLFQHYHLHHGIGYGVINWVGAGGWGGPFHCLGVNCWGTCGC